MVTTTLKDAAITASFVAPATAGPVNIEVTPLREGNRFSQGVATLKQNDKACIHISGNYTDFDALSDVGCVCVTMPIMPKPEDTVTLPQERNIPFRNQVETRLLAEDYACLSNGGKNLMQHRGWVRFTDGRPADLLSLLLFADAYPRAMVMRTGIIGWIPTLELTVQCMSHPAPGYIATHFNSRVLSGGIIEEQGELWDSEGKLVAVCRQSAVPRVPEECLVLLD